jgi:hypothetical protein
MARAVGGVLGNFRGILGKFFAKIVEGETILCMRPTKYKTSYRPKDVELRQRFRVTIAFASKVVRVPALKEIWKMKKEPKLSAFNSITRRNYEFSSAQAPTINNIITPDGFGLPVTCAAIVEGKLTSSLPALDTITEISSIEVNLSINAIVCLSGPKEKDEPYYKIISFSKEEANFNFSHVCNFKFDLNVEDTSEVARYNQKIIYLAVATKTADNKVIKYSRTYSLISG